MECNTPDDDLDEFGQCIDCADDLIADPPVCRGCGNDDGPYGGLCLDCLEADIDSIDGHEDEDLE